MSCSPFDLRDFFLKELPEKEQRQVESHVRSCQTCYEELDRLRLMEAAMLSLRDEEIPQRIAFVSDKIFEPSPIRRWLAAFWASAPRLGFVSAAMLSAAILYSATTRPMPVTRIIQAPAPVTAAQTISDAEIQARIDQAVSKAVTASDQRQEQRYQEAVAQIQQEHRSLILARELLDVQEKHQIVQKAQAYRAQAEGPGEPK